MERFVKGDVVVIPFPFSDLTSSKKRPSVVVSNLKGTDVILCQVTSSAKKDEYAIPLRKKDFSIGGLKVNSSIRTNKLFTAHKDLISYKAGSLEKEKVKTVQNKLIRIIQA